MKSPVAVIETSFWVVDGSLKIGAITAESSCLFQISLQDFRFDTDVTGLYRDELTFDPTDN
jgi:hypothetical protein